MDFKPGQFKRQFLAVLILLVSFLTTFSLLEGQNFLSGLEEKQNYRSKRISSYDPTGGNRDALTIAPGQTAVLAEIKGPAAIHHMWMTVAGEPFYGRKLVLRIYWDGEDSPSVEAPLGDFFGVGHGLNRNLVSLPIVRSSEGRALNCYWYMPFRWSARITITNEGTRPVGSFYYHIDYRELEDLPPDALYFHAQYRQEMPCEPGRNYLILEAVGRGHYMGCNLSVLQQSIGWWGEGDDMIFIDGEEAPSLHGTGSEDYFSDAWGMREGQYLYYGCPLQEEDFQMGAKATVFRFHLPDPITFFKSIRVTIEHGHANDRSDYYSSVAYWYQTEPHKPFPPLPAVDRRLPYALETPDNFVQPGWIKVENGQGEETVFLDRINNVKLSGQQLSYLLTPFYDQNGQRYPVINTENATPGTRLKLKIKAGWRDVFDLQIYYLKGPASGNWSVFQEKPALAEARGESQNSETEKKQADGQEQAQEKPSDIKPAELINLGLINGYAPEMMIDSVKIKSLELSTEETELILEATGKDSRSSGFNLGLVAISPVPGQQNYALDWYVIGPFEAPDMSYLSVPYPPEQELALNKSYPGKNGQQVTWKQVKASSSGYVPLNQLLQPNEKAVAYGLTYLYSPEEREALLLLGSDDGVKLWVNDALVHTNPAYRGAYPDQDKVKVHLQAGWNKILVKVLQGAGGWGYYLRIPDPGKEYRWSIKPGK